MSALPIRPLLMQALQKASDAVALDTELQFTEALLAYRETILYIETIISKDDTAMAEYGNDEDDPAQQSNPARLSANERQRLVEIRNQYIQRVDVLLSSLPSDYTAVYNGKTLQASKRLSKMATATAATTATATATATPTTASQVEGVEPAAEQPAASTSAPADGPRLGRALSRKKTQTKKAMPSIPDSYESAFAMMLMDDPTQADDPEPMPTLPSIVSEALSTPTSAEAAPVDLHKAFWVFRLLLKTMTYGGYVTPRLHVPRQMWFQSGIRLTAMDAKMTTCEVLIRQIDQLRAVGGTNMNELLHELQDMEIVTDDLKVSLAKRLRFVDDKSGGGDDSAGYTTIGRGGGGGSGGTLGRASTLTRETLGRATTATKDKLTDWGSKLSKSVEKLTISRSQKVSDISTYVYLLSKLITESQFIEDLLTHFESAPAYNLNSLALMRLRNIAKFYATVVCPFIVRDFEVLLERFLKKMRMVATV
ncbi:uncharacterized protein BJ171DRAFT_193198 [Polychytrium aggregatum]|uniref:uncharacterized protein n=1 Tax=Polychytrium aggregatum TaxID=110093 RepID=UPI0022FEF638|nr:uncharacterized protein BJ171DRAFT_193198 [Polychytrium aggregatum]KAI9201941.1 hypothetical protein BJ171DRAFT_193198 [Polychytrium aggregatum]